MPVLRSIESHNMPKNENDYRIEFENIYRLCRIRGGFTSQNNAALAIAGMGNDSTVSASSLKDYERGKTIPSPDTVLLLSKAYKTPELKWLHCANSCPIGKKITGVETVIGAKDIYRTYFDLAGAFDQISNVETRLHEIIADDTLSVDEEPALNNILMILDRITESANELKIWAEKHRHQQVANPIKQQD